MTDALLAAPEQLLGDDAIRGGMDLLLFANIHHLRRADERLAELGLGRAHHRALYFIARRPDMTVSDLLSMLKVTKQSFSRVMKELTAKKLLEQRRCRVDARRRLLRLTDLGVEFERTLFDELHANVERAYESAGPSAVEGFWTVMQHLIGTQGREQFRLVQGR